MTGQLYWATVMESDGDGGWLQYPYAVRADRDLSAEEFAVMVLDCHKRPGEPGGDVAVVIRRDQFQPNQTGA